MTYGIAIGAAAAAIAALLGPTRVLQVAEWKSYDARMQIVADANAASPDIVVVEIDENSLEVYRDRLGRWPWSRDAHALLLRYLSAAGARLAVFDVLFPEPDPGDPVADTIFAETLDQFGLAVLALTFSPGSLDDALLWDAQRASEDPSRRQVPTLLRGFALGASQSGDPGATVPLTPFPYVEPPHPLFLRSAAGVGSITLGADPDGVVRWERLVYDHRGTLYPSLGLAAARLLDHERLGGLVSLAAGSLRVGQRALPVDGEGRLLIRWRGPYREGEHTTYPVYPMFHLLNSADQILKGLEPDVPLETFRDKIVLVGVTGVGTLEFDPRPTPLRPSDPGILVHATVIDNLLTGDVLRRAEDGANLALLGAAGVLAGVLTAAAGSGPAGAGAALGLLLVLAALGTWGLALGVWLDFVAPALAASLAAFGSMMANYATEGREKARVRELFSRYVPPEYVRRLADDFESVALGGERAEITILFSDIRGFTNLSERLPPSAVIEILNEYLERMSEVVFRHGGTLDKFIGDAVMAFWGAPVPIADHANKALTAALDMIAELDGLNARWKERGEPTELAIGVGLNTGPAVVGNIGSLTRKLDYTAIGDAVNLASRLESLNKTYGTTILVSESTLTAAGGGYATRAVEAVTVKGKKKPVNVFELLGREEDPAATGGSGPTLRGAMAAAALLVACATGASAQDERARWTDWLYVPGSWSAGQLVRSATSDADTEALALVAHVEAYSSLPRWRVEVSKLSDGETLEAPVVVIGGQTPPVVLTALGSAPLAEHAAAQDPLVPIAMSGFDADGGRASSERGRFVQVGSDGTVEAVIVRRPAARAEFSDDLLDTGAVGRLGSAAGRFGVHALGGERRGEVVASAGARGVARVRTVDGEVSTQTPRRCEGWRTYA